MLFKLYLCDGFFQVKTVKSSTKDYYVCVQTPRGPDFKNILKKTKIRWIITDLSTHAVLEKNSKYRK